MGALKVFSCCIPALILSACIYSPKVDADKPSNTCKTYTKSMSIETLEVHPNLSIRCNSEECLATFLATAAVVTVGSAIISGSIVLTGNTIHWLEYQGTCSDGYLNATKQFFLESVSQPKSAPKS